MDARSDAGQQLQLMHLITSHWPLGGNGMPCLGHCSRCPEALACQAHFEGSFSRKQSFWHGTAILQSAQEHTWLRGWQVLRQAQVQGRMAGAPGVEVLAGAAAGAAREGHI